MPNVKIYVEQALWHAAEPALIAVLEPMRALLCRELAVDVSACQLLLLPVRGLPDQRSLSVEMQILPRADRTRNRVAEVCTALRDLIADSTGQVAAIRVSALDPATYVALK